MCGFKESTSTVSLPTSNGMKNVPLNDDGKIPNDFQTKITKFLNSKEVELESFGPKELTEEQQGKISQIVSYLTGNSTTSSASNSDANMASADDFSFDDDSSDSDESYETETTSSGDDFDFDFDD